MDAITEYTFIIVIAIIGKAEIIYCITSYVIILIITKVDIGAYADISIVDDNIISINYFII